MSRIEVFCKLGQSFLAACGAVYLVIEVIRLLVDGSPCRFWTFLAVSVFFGLAWFFYNGFCLEGFLRSSVTIQSNSLYGTVFEVCKGDLLKESGWRVIAVNEYFDSIVDGMVVAPTSLHGKVLSGFSSDELDKWNQKVTDELEGRGKPLQPSQVRLNPQSKSIQYPIGSTVAMNKNGHKFLFVALTHTNLTTDQASAETSDLSLAIKGVLQEARKYCGDEPLVLPLMGSGLGRVKMHPNMLLHYIIQAVIEECSTEKITGNIKIVIHSKNFKQIDLSIVNKFWRN